MERLRKMMVKSSKKVQEKERLLLKGEDRLMYIYKIIYTFLCMSILYLKKVYKF